MPRRSQAIDESGLAICLGMARSGHVLADLHAEIISDEECYARTFPSVHLAAWTPFLVAVRTLNPIVGGVQLEPSAFFTRRILI